MATWYGRYRAESELSRGGLGVLCCAVDPGQGLQALVKALVLPPSCDAAPGEELATRFRREAKAIRGLKHPSLPQVYEIGNSRGLPYVAVRRVPGATLREEIASQGRLDPDRAKRLAIDLLGALEQMHAAGVFQGPLRAEAILLPRSGDAPQLLDWGFAQADPDAPDPEAAPPLDARGDILQAGILLHEMVTGRSPFGPAGPGPAGIPRIDPSLPADLRRILYVALAADPAQRFAGAAEMARALSGGPMPALRTPAASGPNARQSAAPAAASAIAADAGPADGPKCPQCDSPVGDGDLQCPVCRQMLPVRVRSDREHASSGQAPGPRRLGAPVAGTKNGRRKWAWALAIPLAALILFAANRQSPQEEAPLLVQPRAPSYRVPVLAPSVPPARPGGVTAMPPSSPPNVTRVPPAFPDRLTGGSQAPPSLPNRLTGGSPPPGFHEAPYERRNPLLLITNSDAVPMLMTLEGPGTYRWIVGAYQTSEVEILAGAYSVYAADYDGSAANTGLGLFREFRRYSATFTKGYRPPPLGLGELSGGGEPTW